MKYLKTYEDNINKVIELIGYPEGDIIDVTQEEFDFFYNETDYDIRWDDEYDYEEDVTGQWSFNSEDNEEIKNILDEIRKIGDIELYKKSKKYNL